MKRSHVTNNPLPANEPVIGIICEDKEFDPALKAIIAIADVEKKPREAAKQVKGENKTNYTPQSVEKTVEAKTGKVLIKTLNEAYIPIETTIEQLKRMAKRFFKVNRISFNKNDLPPEGVTHNKALHLIVKCEGYYMKRVMLDGEFGVDICALSTLQRIEIGTERIRPNNVCVHTFDGVKRDTIWEIDLILTIGPVDFEVTFQILDIDTSYNFLLGRPWIHAVGAIPSTIHQMVKFEHEDQETSKVEFLLDFPFDLCQTRLLLLLGGMIHSNSVSREILRCGFPSHKADVTWANERKSNGWVLPQPVPHLARTFVKPKYTEEEEDESFTAEEIEDICGAMRVMPFGLKNVGATYMRAMTAIFHEIMHQEIKVYMDDVIIKSRMQDDHVRDLRKFFEHLRKYDLKLNPSKCAFGVLSGKLFGFIVSRMDIELDPTKIKSIRDLPPP
ncbi:uncharacterized protein [Nicotiana sylvestris]|uniref:uncharacterized protein n=1 Tax=Nicotiana sylvestris TaxID=4096 RepID=UPI00388C6361